jgi:hypothetical protein
MKITLFGLFLIFLILLFIIFNIVFPKNKENFVSSYANCINKGYTKEFCLQTPTSAIGPSRCICPNGSFGTIIPGFRGRCICNNYLF